MRNKLKYFFASKKLLLAQLGDLQRQLQEAWEEKDYAQKRSLAWRDRCLEAKADHNGAVAQLHRVARERDEERRQRRLLDMRKEK